MKRRKSVVTSLPTPSRPRATRVAQPRRPMAASPDVGGGETTTAATPAPRREPSADVVDLGVDLAPGRGDGLALRSPIVVAAGVAGYGVELAESIDIGRLGALCTRGTTLKARPGDPPPRLVEAPAGLLNAVGPQNPGIDVVLERFAPRWATWQVPVILNLCADSVDGFAELAGRAEGRAGVSGLELNLACLERGRGGTAFDLDAAAAARVMRAVRGATDLPVLVKLSAVMPAVRDVARAAEDAGADAICATNTLPGMLIDRESRWASLGSTYGGISGPALKPLALRVVHELSQAVEVPIVGMGGVGCLEDVIDMLLAGADAVAVGTATLADPELPARLGDELAAWCAREGLTSPRQVVGSLRPRGRHARPGRQLTREVRPGPPRSPRATPPDREAPPSSR